MDRIDRFTRKLKYFYRIFTQPKLINNFGIKIKDGIHIHREILKYLYLGTYEISELSILQNTIEKTDRIMDIGAGLGFISIYCAKRIGSANVFAYEANPELIEYIMENFRLNNVNPLVENIILSDHYKEELLFIEEYFWSSSTVLRNLDSKEVKVPARNVNDEIYKLNVNFLIIDIEGGEQNLIPLINFRNNKIKKIIIEMHPHIIGNDNVTKILRLIIESGFCIKLLTSKGIVLYFEREI